MAYIALGALALMLGADIYLYGMYVRATGRLERARVGLEETRLVAAKHRALRAEVADTMARRGVTRARGVVEAVDEVLGPLRIKDKVKSVKPLAAERADEERAEAVIQGITLNEAVNALYAAEYSPTLIIVRKFELKPTFENPRLLTLTLTLSFIKPQA